MKTRDRSGAHPYRKVVANEKGAFGSPSTEKSTNLLTYLLLTSRKCDVFSGFKEYAHIGFKESLELSMNLCSLK